MEQKSTGRFNRAEGNNNFLFPESRRDKSREKNVSNYYFGIEKIVKVTKGTERKINYYDKKCF
ncbi:hypothetical protein M3204_07545 [Mesobacillus subterraneus]|nr:hypothetical protein [Mesobacillus subterraneus]